MTRFKKILAATLVAAGSCAWVPIAAANGGSKPPDWASKPDVVIEWNQLLQQSIGGPPFSQVRGYAMMHIAMADAVIAIEGRYDPYHARLWSPRGASPVAAAAQAARDVFVVLVPAAVAAADALLATRLADIPAGQRALGVAVGKRAAASILEWRQNDGYANANPQPPTLAASTLPGIWRPTVSGAYVFSNIGQADPFGLLSASQFLPAPFPQLESTAYADDVNEVKRVGRNTAPAADRTEAQTRFAQLFAASGPYNNVTNPIRLWSNVARDLSVKKRLSLNATARVFALVNVSLHDSLQTSQYSKEVYRLWRPETAIANADVDNNPLTDADATWVPLVVTPAYPAYASNMTCLGAGGSTMLASLFGGDSQSFSATWYNAAGGVVWTEPYTSLWKLGDDEANSRIWGGIHFRFDIDSSQIVCPQVADYIYDNYMRPENKRY